MTILASPASRYMLFVILPAILWSGVTPYATVAQPQARGTVHISSPDNRIAVRVEMDSGGTPVYVIARNGANVVRRSRLGVLRDDADFSRGLRMTGVSAVEHVTDDYEVLTTKRRINHYRANRRVIHTRALTGARMDIVFQVSNDGVAFRYVFPDSSSNEHTVVAERTSFYMQPGARSWLQPIAVAKIGFGGSNPLYEEHYQIDVPVGVRSPTGAGWVYPALFRTGDAWLLISESGLSRQDAGTRLGPDAPDGQYAVTFPDSREGITDNSTASRSKLPWKMPWRVIVVGSLRTITESMLGVGVADAPVVKRDSLFAPGKASWSWPLKGDAATTYDVQKRFIDYAADMHWQYCLIDALWDVQIGWDRTADLVTYGRQKGVRILVWYNSAGAWNTTPQTPRGKLLTHEQRVAEFSRLKAIGVAGIKVDFFGGDGQSMIAYYHDIMADAAAYGLVVNFHGATLPRGWQRTYPNLMTMEAIKGLEFVTFGQGDADAEPSHAAMLPFTRNVFDPMDFTPMVLDRINRIERRTTSVFELALSILFTSGIQHYAEVPEGMAKAPAYVREFLRHVPDVWDDIRFLTGNPGRFVVIARRSGNQWYIAGINADPSQRTVVLDLRDIPGNRGTLITDGGSGNLSFRMDTVHVSKARTLTVSMRPRGGFVLKLDATMTGRR